MSVGVIVRKIIINETTYDVYTEHTPRQGYIELTCGRDGCEHNVTVPAHWWHDRFPSCCVLTTGERLGKPS